MAENVRASRRTLVGPRRPPLPVESDEQHVAAARPVLRDLTHRLQAAALGSVAGVLRRLGPVRSSELGGALTRALGPRLAVSRVADRNLRRALPQLDAPARARVIRSMWDNLGRTAAELPHLASFRRTTEGPGWEVEGEELVEALRARGEPALFFSGHFGNWELILPIAAGLGLTVTGFYRPASNRHADAALQAIRRTALGPGVSMLPKGSRGARQALLHLERGGSLGFLVDQKMNDGIPVPFFGREAMTAPALAQLALRFGCPVIPVRVVRLGPARFRLVCEPPLQVPRMGDRAAAICGLMRAVNETLERWIRAEPASWLWLHRRWPKEPPGGLSPK